jgi:sec-independent protein translocase protein TatA
MSVGPFQLLIIALVILVLFGRGRISEMMGDFGKGVKSFRQGMSEDDRAAAAAPARIEGPQHDAKPAGEAATSPVASEDKTAG